MVDHLFDPLRRDPPPTKHALEKRADITGTLRSAERDKQHGIKHEPAPYREAALASVAASRTAYSSAPGSAFP